MAKAKKAEPKADVTWIPLIPLIGGFPLGAEKALGKPPEFVASYTGFWANDSQYMNYQNNTLGRNIPYVNLTESPDFKQKVNIVVATPPCAALSQLNCGKTAEVKGAGCAKNDWMYMSMTDAITRFDCDVYIAENAPALATNKGRAVADKLFSIAKSHGYSLGIYKTSTMYHGIPQNRDRTFAFAYKAKTAPVLTWYDKERLNFSQFLEGVSAGELQHDIVINEKLSNEPYFNFIKHYLGKDPRETLIDSGIVTAFTYIQRNGLLQKANDWFHATNNEQGIKYSEHAMKKFSQGLGIWDGSVHVFGDAINAVIGRNMNDSIHPTEDRSLTIREAFELMGFPKDFELVGGRSKTNLIAQNVPVCTASDMVTEGLRFIKNELRDSGCDYFWQNNHNETIDISRATNVVESSIEEFFCLRRKTGV